MTAHSYVTDEAELLHDIRELLTELVKEIRALREDLKTKEVVIKR